MLLLVVSLIPLFAWGVSDYTASRLSDKEHPAAVNLYFTVSNVILAVMLVVLFGVPMFTATNLLQHLLSVILVNAAFLLFMKAFSYGQVGIVAVIANSYALVTVLGSALFLGVDITYQQWIAMSVVLFGIGLLSYVRDPKNHPDGHKIVMSVLFALLAMVGFGLGFLMFDVASTQQWHANFVVAQTVNILIGPLILIAWTRGRGVVKELRSVAKHKIIWLGAAVASIGSAGLYAGIELSGNAAIPSLFATGGPLVTSLLAFYIDKERMPARKWCGVMIVIIGIILLKV